MKFDEFILKINEVIKREDMIYFSYPDEDNGASFGVIEQSNLNGIFIIGEPYFIGDGDFALTNISLHKNTIDAFKHIWDLNNFNERFGSCEEYNFRFDMVDGLTINNCFYILKI